MPKGYSLMWIRILALAVIILSLLSCSEEKTYKDGELEYYANVLTQLYLIQGHYNSKIRIEADGKLDSAFNTDTIYKMYQTTEAEFNKNIEQLRQDTKAFIKIYAMVNTKLDSIQNYIKSSGQLNYTFPLPKKLIDSYKVSSIESDSLSTK